MVTKIATVVLVGSVIALAVGGVTGLTQRYTHDFPFHERMHSRDHFRGHVRMKIRHDIREAREQALSESLDSELKVIEELESSGADVGADARVVGTYAFDANGNPFGKMPWSAHVELKLKPSGQYDLRVQMDIDNDLNEEASWGRYRVVGDRLILYSGHDHDEHELRIAGDQLIFGNDWKQKLALKAVGIDEAVMKKVIEPQRAGSPPSRP
jgi:hypothetical protein